MAPHRLLAALKDLAAEMGAEREVAVAAATEACREQVTLGEKNFTFFWKEWHKLVPKIQVRVFHIILSGFPRNQKSFCI